MKLSQCHGTAACWHASNRPAWEPVHSHMGHVCASAPRYGGKSRGRSIVVRPSASASPSPQPAPGQGPGPPSDVAQLQARVRSRYNAASLAFLGDAVWEAFLRQTYFASGQQPLHSYNLEVKRHANAAQQASYHDHLMELCSSSGPPPSTKPGQGGPTAAKGSSGPIDTSIEPCLRPGAGVDASELSVRSENDGRAFKLTPLEQDVLRWARNSSTVSPPRGMDSLQYKKATALEALVAFLHLTDRSRCTQLMEQLVHSADATLQRP